jgi:hypothetical protein
MIPPKDSAVNWSDASAALRYASAVATSRNATVTNRPRQLAVELCWGARAELGVSGWGRTHQNWAIDLSRSLSSLRASLPLRTHACATRYWTGVSQTGATSPRLVCDTSESPTGVGLGRVGEFAATVNARAGTAWPEATEERSSYKVTGRSTLRSLTEPSMVVLRMRAVFGLNRTHRDSSVLSVPPMGASDRRGARRGDQLKQVF